MQGLVWLGSGTGARRTELGDSRTPPKVLPIDGDYPGGRTGIPLDGYWTQETSHGVQPYFSDAGTDFLDAGVNPVVVTSPNVLDFGYNPAGAVRTRGATFMRGTALAQRSARGGKQGELPTQQLEGWANSYGKGGQIYAYGKVGSAPVATRPDAACYHCLQTTQDEWQRYRACAGVCVVADCVGQCEEKNAAYNYGPTTPVHVTKMCMRQCEVCVGGWVAAANGVRACLLTWLARRSVAPSCTARATQACCDPKMEPDLTVKGAALYATCFEGLFDPQSPRDGEMGRERERERERLSGDFIRKQCPRGVLA